MALPFKTTNPWTPRRPRPIGFMREETALTDDEFSTVMRSEALRSVWGRVVSSYLKEKKSRCAPGKWMLAIAAKVAEAEVEAKESKALALEDAGGDGTEAEAGSAGNEGEAAAAAGSVGTEGAAAAAAGSDGNEAEAKAKSKGQAKAKAKSRPLFEAVPLGSLFLPVSSSRFGVALVLSFPSPLPRLASFSRPPLRVPVHQTRKKGCRHLHRR